ncbi:hypothetical protein KCP74_25865 (plasmid) [Salmonella enterica subsp. enterica]|nr:hypothetical protein KCP74_25865 [Salmonella enterica subsp. enterica]
MRGELATHRDKRWLWQCAHIQLSIDGQRDCASIWVRLLATQSGGVLDGSLRGALGSKFPALHQQISGQILLPLAKVINDHRLFHLRREPSALIQFHPARYDSHCGLIWGHSPQILDIAIRQPTH